MNRNADQFTSQAKAYAQFRPTYPKAVFSYLAGLTPRHDAALDVGTGNGQAACGLADHYRRVIGIDANLAQLSNTAPHPNVTYREASAEATGVEAASVDLVTVAQAAHWFDLETFYGEVRRIVRSGGVLALWCYSLSTVTPEVDRVVQRFYNGETGPYWFPQRRLVDDQYRSLPFPFAELKAPELAIEAQFTAADMLGFLSTWSAVQNYRKAVGRDPLEIARRDLETAWGPMTRTITWPLHFRIGRVITPWP